MDYQAKTDWAYNDTVTEQDLNRIEAGLGDLHQRLDTSATSELVLQPGTQTVQVARDTPFHLSGISGRMLLNLLGRNGNCESLNGWTFTGTGALNTSQFVAGTASIQITAGASGGNMARDIEVIAGKTYILAASIKLGTVKGAYVSVNGLADGSVVTSTNTFMTSYMRFTATTSSHRIAVVLQSTQGQTGYIDAIRLYEISATEYSQLSNMTASTVEQTYPYTEGLAGVKNPYAIRWTSAAKTDVASMLAFDTELLAPPVIVNDAERDRLEQGVDGQYYKTSSWRKVALTGDKSWKYFGPDQGFKTVYSPVENSVKNSGTVIKFDGNILSKWLVGGTLIGPDAHCLSDATSNPNPSIVAISISNKDSGWGDNYDPNEDEIKAYFYGWVMGTQASNGTFTVGYNKTGTKAWRGIVNDTGSGTVDLPKTYFRDQYVQSDWKPYEIIYKRSSVITESITSEGAFNLVQGNNIIEIGSGLMLRESVKPYRDSLWNINNGSSRYEQSLTKFKIDRFIGIYKNGYPDKWTLYPNNITRAGALAQKSAEDYDQNATYTASYIRLDKFPASVIEGSMPANERAILDDLIRDMQQTTRRVSVMESKKTDRDMPNWIAPTLLSGWTTYGDNTAAYRKKDNMVYTSGIVVNGTTANGTVIYRLPNGYRPLKEYHFATYAYTISDASFGLVEIIVRTDGSVVIGQGGRSYISLAGINFTID
jgi:hypothetical protein